jgi:hypothetical protein
MEDSHVRELTQEEVELVSGGLDAGTGGVTIIGLGFAGGPATALFGLAIGGSLLYLDTCA